MRRKYKLTGCAKFAIALILIAPIAYIAASYVNGEDGIQNIKNLLGLDRDTARVEQPLEREIGNDADVYELREVIRQQEKELQDLKEEVRALKEQLGKDRETAPAGNETDTLE